MFQKKFSQWALEAKKASLKLEMSKFAPLLACVVEVALLVTAFATARNDFLDTCMYGTPAGSSRGYYMTRENWEKGRETGHYSDGGCATYENLVDVTRRLFFFVFSLKLSSPGPEFIFAAGRSLGYLPCLLIGLDFHPRVVGFDSSFLSSKAS